MATRKKKRGRPKGSKNKVAGVSKHHVAKKKTRRKKASTVIYGVSKGSSAAELGLLQKINRKVTRIDQTVNAGHHLARKAKRAAQGRAAIEKDWEAVELHGTE